MEKAKSLAAVHTRAVLCKLVNGGTEVPLINMQKT